MDSTTPLQGARFHLANKRQPIPLPAKSKIPDIKGWQELIISEADLPTHFNGTVQNVGVLCGTPSGGQLPVDVDADEGVVLAPLILPPTTHRDGREGREESHYWYTVTGDTLKTRRFDDPERKQRTVELLADGAQCVVWPSVHPSGAPYRPLPSGEPPRVRYDTLRRRVELLNACVLLARYYPRPGSHQRHSYSLALAGTLYEHFAEEEAGRVVVACARLAHDEEAEKRARDVATTYAKIRAQEPATGWPTLRGFLPPAVANELGGLLAAHAGVNSLNSFNSYSNAARAQPWPALDEVALHGLAGDIVRRIGPETEADPAALLVRVLVAVGNAVGRGPSAEVEGTRHGLNEFAVTVGRSSKSRKDTARARVDAVFAPLAGRWGTDCQASGLSSGEGLIHAIRDPEEGGEAGKQVTDPGVEDKRLLVNESEFARVLKVLSRETNTLSAILRDAWDGRDLRVMTRRSPLRATRPHVSMLANVTRDELRRYLTETETVNGFLNRFLVVCVQRSKLLPEGGGQIEISDLQSRVVRVLAWAHEAEPRFQRSPEARALWAKVYARLSADVPGLLGAATSRAEAHVLRLSCLYALLDKSEVVEVDHLRAALALWRYCAESARAIFGDALGDPVADRILDALAGTPDGVTRVEIHALFGRNLAAGRIDAALGLLLAHGRARRTTHRPEGGGRPIERWTPAPPPTSKDEFNEFNEETPAGGDEEAEDPSGEGRDAPTSKDEFNEFNEETPVADDAQCGFAACSGAVFVFDAAGGAWCEGHRRHRDVVDLARTTGWPQLRLPRHSVPPGRPREVGPGEAAWCAWLAIHDGVVIEVVFIQLHTGAGLTGGAT